MKVSFFIVGQPKCGTTALAQYLSEHPKVCFASPKETYYFAPELNLTGRSIEDSVESYHRLFEGYSGDQVCGEGSINYLLSKTAASKILEYNSDARFVVILREPAKMLYSWHNHLVLNLLEMEKCFKKAWDLQESRETGHGLKILPNVTSEVLKWRQWVSYGTLLEHLFSVVPKEQCRVYIFDDFKEDAAAIYGDILEFLGLPDDHRKEFPFVNKSRKNRPGFGWLIRGSRFVSQEYREKVKHWLKKELNIDIHGKYWKFLKPEHQMLALDEEMRRMINESFRSEIEKAGKILNRDLPKIWL